MKMGRRPRPTQRRRETSSTLDDTTLYALAKRDATIAYARRHHLSYKQAAAILAPQFTRTNGGAPR